MTITDSEMLRHDIEQMKDYLRLKLFHGDWHGVSDAANDIREMEAKMELAKEVEDYRKAVGDAHDNEQKIAKLQSEIAFLGHLTQEFKVAKQKSDALASMLRDVIKLIDDYGWRKKLKVGDEMLLAKAFAHTQTDVE